MIGNTCIKPVHEQYLIDNKIRYEKCISKSGYTWLKIYPYDEEKHFDFFHSIDTYVSMVLED